MVDPESFKAALQEHARRVRAWDPEEDPDGAELQTTLLAGSALARALQDHGHRDTGPLRIRKFPGVRSRPDWTRKHGHHSEKHGRFIWSALIHCCPFTPDADRQGFYVYPQEQPDHRDHDTGWFVTFHTLLLSWGVS